MRVLPYITEGPQAKSKPLADAVSGTSVVTAVLWSIPALALMGWSQGATETTVAMALWALTLMAVLRWLRRRLQGFTGDTLGATQQLCELALYLGLALA